MTDRHTGVILVVDDSPSNVLFLTEVLMQRGHTVHAAADGLHALRSARNLLPDLILLDIVMPGLDGFKVCQFLKSSADTCDIPVIFMTSLSDTRDKIRGFELGAADYVTKPFQVEEVLARVETLLALRAMHKRLESNNAQLQGANEELARVNMELSSKIAQHRQAEVALQENEERLKRYQEQLERRVNERTAELAEANSHLQNEISERRVAEELVKSSLAEKEVLLKEIHHRVKNNLQIISTLLDLQSDSIRDEEAIKSFRESQDRIKAMALIHERLYESQDMASIDFGRYIGDLSVNLFDSYQTDPGRVSLRVDCGDISMGIDRAIPCGLIVNELVSNALKHAFPDGRKGEISIRLQCGDDGLVSITVSDNGIGLPSGVNFRNTATLGLQLVIMLTKQLEGEIDLCNENGAAFTISFMATPGG